MKIENVRLELRDNCLAVVEDRLRSEGIDYGDVVEYASLHGITVGAGATVDTLVGAVVMHVFYHQQQ